MTPRPTPKGRAFASEKGGGSVRAFTKALLKDLQALEQMLEEGLIESDVRRFGCEQEMFLVNRAWRPAPVAMEVLDRLDGEAFTHGIGTLQPRDERRAHDAWRRLL